MDLAERTDDGDGDRADELDHRHPCSARTGAESHPAILELPAGLVARNAALYLALNTDMAVNEAIALLIAVASPASVTELPRTGNGCA